MRRFLYSKILTDRLQPIDQQINELFSADDPALEIDYDIVPLPISEVALNYTFTRVLIIAYAQSKKKILNEVTR